MSIKNQEGNEKTKKGEMLQCYSLCQNVVLVRVSLCLKMPISNENVFHLIPAYFECLQNATIPTFFLKIYFGNATVVQEMKDYVCSAEHRYRILFLCLFYF